MSNGTRPVWVWLPDQIKPIECGKFTLHNKVGSFAYLDAYLDLPSAIPLDPRHLPLGTTGRTRKETSQGGLFGVIRDAKPEGYGLDLLANVRKIDPSDHLQVLEHSEGDTVGAIEVCEDIGSKLAYRPPQSTELLTVLAKLPDIRPSSDAVRELRQVVGTSAGGERPKLTVMHEGQMWLAKLQDRGDRPHAPLREYVAMRVARACGVQTADVQFKLIGKREVILVRRFDRHVDASGGVTRRPYASAHTVLHLDNQVRGDRERSYVSLGIELTRWCATAKHKAVPELRRELWRRIVLNSILGNGDDHPRNTGLVFDGTTWTLSPAFDIAPYGHGFAGTHAMDISRSRTHAASGAVHNLMRAAPDFDVPEDEAREFIASARALVPQHWREEVVAAGFNEADLPMQEPTWLDAPAPPEDNRRRRLKST